MDLTQYTIKDVFTGRIIRVSDELELSDWLGKSYATMTEQQEKMIKCLAYSFENGDEHGIKWYGRACDLNIEPKKKTRRKKT